MTVAEPHHRQEWSAAGQGFRGADTHETRLLATMTQPRTGERALDVVCGLGSYAAELAAPGCRTPAVDWSEAAVPAARGRYTDLEPRPCVHPLDFADTAGTAAPLPRAGSDLVTMRPVLAFPDDKAAVSEHVRALPAPAADGR
ncbi:class I SAM-dependent methyltransferase [Streptomyces sp. NPDC058964]|uniref:class I SAM-dependent methyltransferase n=1 Tax=Streptomyces sp. NPDC058964 TaxID=3346681 RepID=UPI0036D01DD3